MVRGASVFAVEEDKSMGHQWSLPYFGDGWSSARSIREGTNIVYCIALGRIRQILVYGIDARRQLSAATAQGAPIASALLSSGLARYLMVAARLSGWLLEQRMENRKNMTLCKPLILCCLVLCCRSLYGHPGHGVNPAANEPWHYLVEPQHAIFWLLAASLVYLAYRAARRAVQN
jgi:hypothetical protein